MAILVFKTRLRIAAAMAVMGLSLAGCGGDDDTLAPTDTPPALSTPLATAAPTEEAEPTATSAPATAQPTAAPTATAAPATVDATPTATDATANPLLADGAIATEEITIESPEVDLKAYLARPAAEGPAPAVIVIHENRGLVPYVRDVADGLASNGYVAVAPDLLSREGGTEAVADVPAALRGISNDRHATDVEAVVGYLKNLPDVTKIGIIGFCFGGGVVWHFITVNGDIDAAVPFYGSAPAAEGVPNITAEVFAVYGEQDERINAGIPALNEAFANAGKTYESKIYPGSPHAFHNHTNAGRYNPETAPEAWQDALAWFDQHLKG